MKKTPYVEKLAEQFPSSRIFCHYLGKFCLDSASYTKSSNNSFVEMEKINQVGQILAFFDNGSVKCLIKVSKVVRVVED